MSHTYKNVGAFFKKAREEMGVTQQDAAIAVEATVGMIKQYEGGTVMPRLTTALALCHLYDVSWSSLESVLLASNGEALNLAPAPKSMCEIQQLNTDQLQSWRKKRIALLCTTVYTINS